MDALERAERGLYESMGLFVNKDLRIRNVVIHQQLGDPENYIHEVKVIGNKPNLPKLVMIHGFGGGGAQFFMMVKHLRDYFEIYMIDVLGQGMSGRPEYEIKSDFDSTVAYFTDSI